MTPPFPAALLPTWAHACHANIAMLARTWVRCTHAPAAPWPHPHHCPPLAHTAMRMPLLPPTPPQGTTALLPSPRPAHRCLRAHSQGPHQSVSPGRGHTALHRHAWPGGQAKALPRQTAATFCSISQACCCRHPRPQCQELDGLVGWPTPLHGAPRGSRWPRRQRLAQTRRMLRAPALVVRACVAGACSCQVSRQRTTFVPSNPRKKHLDKHGTRVHIMIRIPSCWSLHSAHMYHPCRFHS